MIKCYIERPAFKLALSVENSPLDLNAKTVYIKEQKQSHPVFFVPSV